MFSTKFEPGRADLSGSSGFMVPTGTEGGGARRLQRLGHVGWIAVDAAVMVVEAVRRYRNFREPVT